MKVVVSRNVMQRSEKYAIGYLVSSKELMNRAGMAVMRSYNFKGEVLVITGSGNNAGDGYALALHLKERNISVTIALVSNKFSLNGKVYFEMCKKNKIPIYMVENVDFSKYDILVDAIYGCGFKGILPKKEAEVIKMINNSQKKVISIDINSGLDADSGITLECVKSDLTVAIGSYKLGHFLNMAKDNIKELKCVDIGIPIIGEKMSLMEKDDFKDILKDRLNYSHKGSYGLVAVMGGCLEYSGSVKLANMSLSALRAGSGVSRLIVPRSIAPGVLPYLLESTLMPVFDEEGKMVYNKKNLEMALEKVTALLVGIGWGESREYQLILKFILENYAIPLILDADGINTLSKMNLDILKNTKCKVILTPHIKEFSRLSGYTVDEILNNPVELAQVFADKYKVILLLKGTTTIVTDGFKTELVNRGCAGMATAGSGDVLSGIILGLCGFNDVSIDVVSCGAYINGLAGEMASGGNDISMLSSDTINYIGRAIASMK